MKKFPGTARVRIIDPTSPFCGIAGTVWRVMIRSKTEAWVRLDTWPDGQDRRFDADDDRRNNEPFDAWQCEPEIKKVKGGASS